METHLSERWTTLALNTVVAIVWVFFLAVCIRAVVKYGDDK